MFIVLAVNISEEFCSAVKSGRGTWHQRPVIGSVDWLHAASCKSTATAGVKEVELYVIFYFAGIIMIIVIKCYDPPPIVSGKGSWIGIPC